jgi:hypothetical protein
MGKVLKVAFVLHGSQLWRNWKIEIYKNAGQNNTKVNYGPAKRIQIHCPPLEKVDGNVRTEQV